MAIHGRKKAIAEPTPPARDPRDVETIARLQQQIQELEFQQLLQDSPAEETETESNIWDDGSEDVNPFGGGNPLFHGDHHDHPLLTKETESEPIFWDIGDEEEEYPFVNKYPNVIEEEEGFFNNPHQVSYNIPKALPVDVGCITTASIVSTPVNSGNLSLPVVYPVLKREPKPFSGLIVPEANSPYKDFHEIEELSASEEDQDHHDTSNYDNRTQAVTFHEPESSTTGNKFTMKESCIVCDAKYCSKYVLRVIRAMPEGRKCITCIGYPIKELKRGRLGRCLNVLKNLLTDNQVKQVMTFKKSHRVNQASYWLIIVNGEPLSFDKVLLLQTCAYPPKRLVPRSYWYDKMFGLWGKEGNKPSQVISPRLSIRGSIKEDASNGNTNVKINGWVISKSERLIFKVETFGQFQSDAFDWLSRFNEIVKNAHDREDQENVVNELVFLEKDGSLLKVQVDEVLLVDVELKKASCRVEAWKVLRSKTPLESVQQVIVVATELQIENEKMSEFEDVIRMSEDLSAVIPTLDAVKGALSVVKSWLTKSKPFLASDLGLMPILNSLLRVDILKNFVLESKSLKILVGERSLLEDVFVIEKLWNDEGFQVTFARRNEFSTLPMVAEYFLSRAVEISSMTYEPSDEDILYADGITFSNGPASMEYSVPSTLPVTFMDATEHNHAPLQRCQLIRVKMTKTRG
ncbi:lysine-specific demethylase 5D isoform X1 [Tanacetum coccineum]